MHEKLSASVLISAEIFLQFYTCTVTFSRSDTALHGEPLSMHLFMVQL